MKCNKHYTDSYRCLHFAGNEDCGAMKGERQVCDEQAHIEEEILYLNVYKFWFDKIARGFKKEEFRQINPYWIKRLSGKKYTHALIKNGYNSRGRKAPEIKIKINKIVRVEFIKHFVIELGEIEYINNYPEVIENGD